MDNDSWELDTGMGHCIVYLLMCSYCHYWFCFAFAKSECSICYGQDNRRIGGLISSVVRHFPFGHGVKNGTGADTASCLVDTAIKRSEHDDELSPPYNADGFKRRWSCNVPAQDGLICTLYESHYVDAKHLTESTCH
jgi:hypothetical protein